METNYCNKSDGFYKKVMWLNVLINFDQNNQE